MLGYILKANEICLRYNPPSVFFKTNMADGEIFERKQKASKLQPKIWNQTSQFYFPEGIKVDTT